MNEPKQITPKRESKKVKSHRQVGLDNVEAIPFQVVPVDRERLMLRPLFMHKTSIYVLPPPRPPP